MGRLKGQLEWERQQVENDLALLHGMVWNYLDDRRDAIRARLRETSPTSDAYYLLVEELVDVDNLLQKIECEDDGMLGGDRHNQLRAKAEKRE